jgi:hypothetical protein
VHGVAVSDPALAALLRKAGWFSGKAAKPVDVAVVVERDPTGAALEARRTGDVDAGGAPADNRNAPE